MPYIKCSDRHDFDYGIAQLDPKTPGELNYVLTSIIDYYIRDVNYSKLNEVIGVLECAKLELYRRVAGPYEDKKIKENGDVYSGQDERIGDGN